MGNHASNQTHNVLHLGRDIWKDICDCGATRLVNLKTGHIGGWSGGTDGGCLVTIKKTAAVGASEVGGGIPELKPHHRENRA